jgi:hypothetical protein
MTMTRNELQQALLDALRGMARLQARQDAMECVLRAIIVEAPPAHPLIWKALQTAQSDLHQRWAAARAETPPQMDADAMQLLNVLRDACAPPTEPGSKI